MVPPAAAEGHLCSTKPAESRLGWPAGERGEPAAPRSCAESSPGRGAPRLLSRSEDPGPRRADSNFSVRAAVDSTAKLEQEGFDPVAQGLS